MQLIPSLQLIRSVFYLEFTLAWTSWNPFLFDRGLEIELAYFYIFEGEGVRYICFLFEAGKKVSGLWAWGRFQVIN